MMCTDLPESMLPRPAHRSALSSPTISEHCSRMMPNSIGSQNNSSGSGNKSIRSRHQTAWIDQKCTIVRFVDTNILLYAISTDAGEREKSEKARTLLESRDLALSVQVIQEFYVQATRPNRHDALSQEQTRGLIQSFMRFPIQEISMAVALLAMENSRKFQLSYWDAAIIEAARVMQCELVLSEDMSHDHDYGGVMVVNPFL